MDWQRFFQYCLVMAGVTYLVRALPFVLLRRRIQSPFIRSVLYYMPYAVLGAMTIPDALYATGNTITAGIGLAVAFVAALRGLSMVWVALCGSVAAILAQLVIGLL